MSSATFPGRYMLVTEKAAVSVADFFKNTDRHTTRDGVRDGQNCSLVRAFDCLVRIQGRPGGKRG